MCHLCPHVKICCFCYSLRTGSFIIGWIYLVLSIIGFLASIFVSLFHLTRSDVLLDKLCDCSGLVRTDYEWNRLWEECQNNTVMWKCQIGIRLILLCGIHIWFDLERRTIGGGGRERSCSTVSICLRFQYRVPSLQRTRSVNTCLLWIFPISHLCCSLKPDRVGFHILLLYSRVQSVQNDGEGRRVLDGRPRFGLYLTSQMF